MSKFKRASLAGSEELFRPTRPTLVEDGDDVITEVIDRKPKERHYRQLNLTQEEIGLLVDAVQIAKYPDRVRPKPPLEKFERLDALKSKLQGDAEAG